MQTEAKSIHTTVTTASQLAALDLENLQFGKIFADHMLEIDYKDGAWQQPRILPYGPIQVSPATAALHYGQSLFEGMKAYKTPEGEVVLFRPQANWARLNASAVRLCMPEIPEELFMEGLKQLVALDAKWVPQRPGYSLYIRPFMFGSEGLLGVRPATEYKFMIFCSPASGYYAEPVRVKIEEHYTRAVEGGFGFAKAAGNYGGSLLPAKLAHEEGYHQIIWTDGREHNYIEESGTMNVMFVIDGKLVTPALSTSILAGITRDSVLQLARDWGVPVEERRIPVQEIVEAYKAGKLQDAFGTGTAATIAHIKSITFRDEEMMLPPVADRTLSNKIATELDNIRYGLAPDPYGWVVPVQ
ncbi:branched-chain amino acid aminotransferase [Rufibacter glacialis]|uniref:branched-chain-amino-acid transaminase n=1 Tax=Rufibacter glacialis TaxID=1259555 RepID=A0A5M8QL81_9BACT|nr:branched-chain amino acid aminotransferase [Rufibacter glacialis]KAA6435740.1 branched-chain amino acid aminotransferase [Rufibacter glacialis]GGK66119.1 putative branched-chain-amino-acid aminotransferase [Rufibacter glacialis]